MACARARKTCQAQCIKPILPCLMMWSSIRLYLVSDRDLWGTSADKLEEKQQKKKKTCELMMFSVNCNIVEFRIARTEYKSAARMLNGSICGLGVVNLMATIASQLAITTCCVWVCVTR